MDDLNETYENDEYTCNVSPHDTLLDNEVKSILSDTDGPSRTHSWTEIKDLSRTSC